jgi:hypothetical protein
VTVLSGLGWCDALMQQELVLVHLIFLVGADTTFRLKHPVRAGVSETSMNSAESLLGIQLSLKSQTL